MTSKRAIRLEGSDEVLQTPDDSIERNVLENILEDATERKINRSKLIIVTHSERVTNFNQENPRWKNVTYKIPLHELFEMYKSIVGEHYREPTLEELQRKHRVEPQYY